MPRHEVEIIEAVSRMAQDIAKSVAEGMGEGIAKAMGYGLITQPPPPEEEKEPDPFFPDVELDGNWINPDIMGGSNG